MTQYGFYVNTDICIGCKACMTACFDRQNLEVPLKFRKVYEFGGGEWEQDDTGAFTTTSFTYYASMTCGQCDNPACVANCPTGAMQKDEELGLVNNDKSLCIGCMTCQKTCPYHHPQQFADGLSWKCVMCTDESPDATPDPACAKACPMRCLESRCRIHPDERSRWRQQDRRASRRDEPECGILPSSRCLEGRNADEPGGSFLRRVRGFWLT